jgi:dienelactone hydrolase
MSNCIRTIRQLALTGLFVIGLPHLGLAESALRWGKLPPGPHGVGFKSLWRLDDSRRYNMTFDDRTTYASCKAPRPILINIWYPAKKDADDKPMPHREYLEIKSADPQLAKFSTKLAEYNRAVIAQELMGRSAKELSDTEKGLLTQFLDSPTFCIRNAPPKEGKFPLVIYHSGHGSSFEDNSILCEFLASQGYVVLGSAFQNPSGTSFGVDGNETSVRDLEYLIGYARQLPGVDWNHIGVIGHSGGAHAALMFRAQSHCAADAIISLDTTQDYYSLVDNRWEDMTTTVVKNRRNMTGPLLLVANPHAFFQMADSLSSARRYYLTIKELDHNDFIAQGCIRKDLRYRLHLGDPNQTAEDRAKEKAGLGAVEAGYDSLCAYVLRFLDAELKGDAPGIDFLAKQYRNTKLGGDEPHVDYMPEGRTDADPYKEDIALPPTPRQLRPFLRERGSERTIAVLKRFRKEAPTQPIYHPVFALALVGELLEQGKTPDAIAFHNYYREAGTDCGKMLLEWGKTYLGFGLKRLAADNFKKVLLLEPGNDEAAAKLKGLEGSEKKPGGR